jgi:hypothetical protein
MHIVIIEYNKHCRGNKHRGQHSQNHSSTTAAQTALAERGKIGQLVADHRVSKKKRIKSHGSTILQNIFNLWANNHCQHLPTTFPSTLQMDTISMRRPLGAALMFVRLALELANVHSEAVKFTSGPRPKI